MRPSAHPPRSYNRAQDWTRCCCRHRYTPKVVQRAKTCCRQRGSPNWQSRAAASNRVIVCEPSKLSSWLLCSVGVLSSCVCCGGALGFLVLSALFAWKLTAREMWQDTDGKFSAFKSSLNSEFLYSWILKILPRQALMLLLYYDVWRRQTR